MCPILDSTSSRQLVQCDPYGHRPTCSATTFPLEKEGEDGCPLISIDECQTEKKLGDLG